MKMFFEPLQDFAINESETLKNSCKDNMKDKKENKKGAVHSGLILKN